MSQSDERILILARKRKCGLHSIKVTFSSKNLGTEVSAEQAAVTFASKENKFYQSLYFVRIPKNNTVCEDLKLIRREKLHTKRLFAS